MEASYFGDLLLQLWQFFLVQILLKKQSDKYETKLTIDNKDYIFNFKEKYDLEIKTGDMVTIKNEFYNELDKIERNIKEQKKLRLDQHIHHNQLEKKKQEKIYYSQ